MPEKKWGCGWENKRGYQLDCSLVFGQTTIVQAPADFFKATDPENRAKRGETG